MKSGYRLLAASLVVFAIFPCAIDSSPEFIPRAIPEKFDTAFVRGELGIIPPTLSSRYKLVAWRYLSGLPLDSSEQAAIPLKAKQAPGSGAKFDEWRKARTSTGSAAEPGFFYINTSKSSHLKKGVYYENCLADAFTVAAATLYDRQKSYSDSALVQDWLTAQDQVFKNCSADQPVYPADPASGLTPLATADRMYQIAAARFYAEDLTGAEQRFRAIAADATSPWRDTAGYMIARTLIREAALMDKPEALQQAKAQLVQVTAADFQNSARSLISYIDSLQNPSATLESIAAKLAVPHPGTVISEVIDEGNFVLITDRYRAIFTQPGLPEPFDWALTLASDNAGHALQRWQLTHSILWLTPALIHANASQPEAAALIQAALNVPANSPAYDTVTFHTIRLMMESGQTTQARQRLDTLLHGKRRNLDSVDNAYRQQRSSIATSFDDLLHWAPRRPIGIAEEEANYGPVDDSLILGDDAATAFNSFTPISKLIEAAQSTHLPAASRAQLAITAWTRAFILKDDSAADKLSLSLAQAHPSWAPDLEAFRTATGEEKRFAGALLIARHADFHTTTWLAFSPEWWCAETPGVPPAPVPSSAALSPAERKIAEAELQRIQDAGPAQTFLAPIVMSWSNTHPDDPRVPEALHRLVRVTRYGCYGVPGNGVISKTAFDLLHSRFPNNEWTKQTPYWFDK